MALLTKAPRGTQDVLPPDGFRIRQLENILAETAEDFGFHEIRTPVFEHTELFCRSVGETSDVVQKEMYTFEDNGKRSVTLRPEGTAGCARAFLEHGLFNEPLPQKFFYHTSCYRYEKPQAGRYREFHQFGVECIGAPSPAADAEIIALANAVFNFFELDDISLEINSIGCPSCRAKYHKALKAYFENRKSELCETCLSRLEKNPMRILDCKSPVCSEIAKGAPVVLDYLCDECAAHFKAVQKYLDGMEIEYKINPRIVRGLDYYTKTVFEFVCSSIGAQGTVCGGGRYDGLIEELGGASLPACGFGMGTERLMLLLEAQGKKLPQEERIQLYIAPAAPEYSVEAMRITNELRSDGVSAVTDLQERSLKAQLKYANKIKAMFTLVLGADEIESRTAKVKDMDSGEVSQISLDTFSEDFMHISINSALAQIEAGGADLTLLTGGKE